MTTGEPLVAARRDEAAADADQAAALGRHRDARAGRRRCASAPTPPSSRRPASWGRRWSRSSSPTPTARSSAATTSTTSSRRVGALRGADRVAAALNPALVFIGFMGAGKSTAALEAAAALGEPRPTRDALLEAELGERDRRRSSTATGEPAFRAAEEELVGDAARAAPTAASSRSAAARCCSERVRAALRPPHGRARSTSTSRPPGRAPPASGRPLARDRDAFARALRATRRPLYEDAADAIVPGTGDPHVVRARARRRCARSPAGPTAAVGDERLGRLPGVDRRAAVDAGAVAGAPGAASSSPTRPSRRLHAGRGRRGAAPAVIAIPPGEEHKTLATAERDLAALVAAGRHPRRPRRRARRRRRRRPRRLLRGDLPARRRRSSRSRRRSSPRSTRPTAARPASTCPRPRTTSAPTTSPRACSSIPALLATLPPAELAAGYAEVVKTALIAGGSLWERVAAGAPVDDDVIVGCARTKLRVVAADERDGGAAPGRSTSATPSATRSRPSTGYARYRHGEAVGLGLLAALRLSGQDALREQVAELLVAAGLPTRLDGVDPAAVGAATARDKKRLGDDVPFVLVHAPGRRAPRRHAVGCRRAAAPPCES